MRNLQRNQLRPLLRGRMIGRRFRPNKEEPRPGGGSISIRGPALPLAHEPLDLVPMDVYNLISFSGIFVLMGVAWLVSESRRTVNWRVMLWGTALPLLFALFLFIVPAGARVFIFINDGLVHILDSAAAGARFLFGRLALPPGTTGDQGETSLGFILAFQAFPTIVFFSALMSILYYCNILPRIIRSFAWVFTKLMKVSGAESLHGRQYIRRCRVGPRHQTAPGGNHTLRACRRADLGHGHRCLECARPLCLLPAEHPQ